MKKIKLIHSTYRKYALVNNSDYEWLNQWKWYWVPTTPKPGVGYAQRVQWMGSGKKMHQISMHRLITGCVYGDGKKVDHVNGNSLNNQRYNLRVTDNFGNTRNARKKSSNTSGYKGVSHSANRKKWVVNIRVDGKQIRVGTYANLIKAAKVYDEFALKHYGEFARLNFPTARPKR